MYFHGNKCPAYSTKVKGSALANIVQDTGDYGLDRLFEMLAVLTVCPSVPHLNTQVVFVYLDYCSLLSLFSFKIKVCFFLFPTVLGLSSLQIQAPFCLLCVEEFNNAIGLNLSS